MINNAKNCKISKNQNKFETINNKYFKFFIKGIYYKITKF